MNNDYNNSKFKELLDKLPGYLDSKTMEKVLAYFANDKYKTEKWADFDKSFKSAGDYEFMLRMLYKHNLKVAYIPHVQMKMRAGGVSNASFKNRIRANKEDRRAWKINGLKPKWYTLWWKPLSKVFQFLG